MSRIVITGGSGFIGTNLVDHFSANGHEVLNLDIAPPRKAAHQKYWMKSDLMEGASLKKNIGSFSPEFILHMGRANRPERAFDCRLPCEYGRSAEPH